MIPARILLPGLAISLAMTLVCELAYALGWGVRDRRDLVLCALVNVLTNPIVGLIFYYVWYHRPPVKQGIVTLVTEILAVVTEALLYRRFARTIRRPWLFAVSANAFSYAVGELINGIR